MITWVCESCEHTSSQYFSVNHRLKVARVGERNYRCNINIRHIRGGGKSVWIKFSAKTLGGKNPHKSATDPEALTCHCTKKSGCCFSNSPCTSPAVRPMLCTTASASLATRPYPKTLSVIRKKGIHVLDPPHPWLPPPPTNPPPLCHTSGSLHSKSA